MLSFSKYKDAAIAKGFAKKYLPKTNAFMVQVCEQIAFKQKIPDSAKDDLPWLAANLGFEQAAEESWGSSV